MPGDPFYPGPTGCAGRVGTAGGSYPEHRLAESPSKADRPPPTDAANAIQDSPGISRRWARQSCCCGYDPPPLRRPLEEGERWSAEITVWLCLLFWWPGVHLYRWDRTVAMGEIIVPRGVVPLEDTSFGTKALMASVILEDFCLHVCVCVFRHQTLAVLYEKEADHDLSHGLKLIPPMLVANGESRP